MLVSILGCGWLGLPLAEHLIQKGYRVNGSTTTIKKIQKLRARNIDPFLIQLNPGIEDESKSKAFWRADTLVLNVPPGRGRDTIINYHTGQIQSVIDAITGTNVNHVIFVSSTSVYPPFPGNVAETDTIPGKAGRDSGNALLQAEEMLMKASDFGTTVLRFGGLYGGERHPAKYLAGRTGLGKANAPVNLIHRDDCIALITQILEQQITGEIFNAVADAHPTRQEYYTKTAKALGLEPPAFEPDNEPKSYKIVSNKKLKETLNYTFIHPELTISSQA